MALAITDDHEKQVMVWEGLRDSLRRVIEVDSPLGANPLHLRHGWPAHLDATLGLHPQRLPNRSARILSDGRPGIYYGPNANPTAPAQRAATTPASCPGNFVTCYRYDGDGRRMLEQAPLTGTTSRIGIRQATRAARSVTVSHPGGILPQRSGHQRLLAQRESQCGPRRRQQPHRKRIRWL
jgi:hypothetical protein